tara:strand:+ start:2828 stop:3412 length:585 start_codon:yes stop_codon:yes gene_type:complete
MSFSKNYLEEAAKLCGMIDAEAMENLANELVKVRENGGRLFILGVGGSAANCSHAVNDFRKLCGIEAYAPTDNVSELTARTNDEGWETVFSAWMDVSKANEKDSVLVFSVGGGNAERQVSMNIVRGLQWAKEKGLKIFGIVSRDGGFTAEVGDNVLIVPVVHPDRVTPHAEAFQAVIWHGLVSHPKLQIKATKW